MMRSAPSISTTGPAGDSSRRKYGSDVSLARGAELLGAIVVAHLVEDVGGGPHVGCAVGMALDIVPVASRRDLNTFIKLPWRLYRNEPHWVAPLISERRKFLDRERNPFFGTPRPSTSSPCATAARSGRITAHIDRNFNEFQDNDWGMFGFFECENDPEAAAALLRRRRGLAAGPRPRPHGRPDGLLHQRRVRDPHRGPRAPAADPLALDHPVLRRAHRGRRPGARRWTS